MTRIPYRYPIENAEDFPFSAADSPAHKGDLRHAVDFIVPVGTPIHAAAEGVVIDVKADSSAGGEEASFDSEGNYIEIQHASGECSIYEHIRQHGSAVQRGEWVRKGQLIGYSGDTGWLARLGPHLHFDVHVYEGAGYKSVPIRWEKP